MKYTIGIDIGGTHTDGVLVDEKGVICKAYKTLTKRPLAKGVFEVIVRLQEFNESAQIEGVFVGTTHATNAILEAKGLTPIGLIRIGSHKPQLLPPCYLWPKHLHSSFFIGVETVLGGHHTDGSKIGSLSKMEVKEACLKLKEKGALGLAVVSPFSPLIKDHELECMDIIQDALGPDFPVTLSSEIGGIGLIERENGALLNAALKETMKKELLLIESLKEELKLKAPFYLTQNNGSLITFSEASEKPILTISSGPTNSFIGASRLANLQEAIVLDIGGTSTDIGIVNNGFPTKSFELANIGGVPLNFRMPDVEALSIGGGSLIRQGAEEPLIGPDSVGKELFMKSKAFGGDVLTLTDVCLKLKLFEMKDASLQKIPLTKSMAKLILTLVQTSIQKSIEKIRGLKTDFPIVVVGGGAYAFSKSDCLIPENHFVANAYGASLAEISYTLDTVRENISKTSVIENLKEEVIQGVLSKGADPKEVRIIDLVILPYSYLPKDMGRIIITAAGKRI